MATPNDLQDHLVFMISQKRRNLEVSIRSCNDDGRRQFEEAKDKETYQWVSNSVFKIVRRAGVPVKMIMAMRWILTWKEAPEGTKAKARLVATVFTDPDLLTIRAETPTLNNIGRHCLLHMACSHQMKIEVGDVPTAFLQGDKEENNRDVYLEPTANLRARLKITKNTC